MPPTPRKTCCKEERNAKSKPAKGSCPGAYDYLTFNQFREVKELLGFFKKDKLKFFLLTLVALLYFAAIFGLYMVIVKNLNISFSGPSPVAPGKGKGSLSRSYWEILRPKLTDLWRQC
ncbi:hypothetical protein M8J76_014191 [Diaphorina citri]|nr:hypothetical protein M8J75_006354 [Diaphorina citri]KAI5724012.1 hypothetical protein M8J76_014191 [Diaphorina citri]